MKDHLLNLIRLNPTFLDSYYDWNNILRLANEQSILGVTLYGMQKCHSDKLPSKAVLLKLIAYAEAIKRQNEKEDVALRHLLIEFCDKGLNPIVVKGQVIAQEYEEPQLRQSGDIDILFVQDDWREIQAWLKNKKIHYTSSIGEKHIEFNFMGITIELHWRLNAFSSRTAMRYWEKEVEGKVRERQRAVNVDGVVVQTLGVTDTLVYLIVHVHHHLLTQGVGLRQLMDIALFVNNHFDEIDISILRQHLKGIEHEKAFNAYMALLNKYLGLPKEKIPLELDLTDYIYADKIMDEVWRGGNFGHKNNLQGVKSGLLHSLNTARLVMLHSFRFYRLAPSESCSYWWHKIFWRMNRKAK